MLSRDDGLVSGARAVARCRQLAVPPFSDFEKGLYRGYLTPAYQAAQEQLREWMEAAGLSVRVDPAANMIGRYEGLNSSAPALIVGSHLDSVRDGGAFDGPLGILLAVEMIEGLASEGVRLPFPIEIYAFGDEEGSRFPNAMLTSLAVAGKLQRETLDIADADGVSLAEAGVDPDLFLDAVRPDGSTLAYFETHIEQGPVLEAEGLAVGTVTGIAAQRRYRFELSGVAGHAGTVAMGLRKDALAGAAEMIGLIERFALDDESDLVATVGTIDASPGALNVIPGSVVFTLDVRSGDEARRDRAAEAILGQMAQIAERRGLILCTGLLVDLPASPCDAGLMDLLDGAMADADQPIRRLVSGAGHDAMNFADMCPIAMLFIRCRDGISHNPAEHVEPRDADIALRVMRGFVERLGDVFVDG